jgi:hypothetical protein
MKRMNMPRRKDARRQRALKQCPTCKVCGNQRRTSQSMTEWLDRHKECQP